MSNLQEKLQTVEELIDYAAYGNREVAAARLTVAMSHLLEAVRELEARQSKEEARHGQH